jgi:hypothetical protein
MLIISASCTTYYLLYKQESPMDFCINYKSPRDFTCQPAGWYL